MFRRVWRCRFELVPVVFSLTALAASVAGAILGVMISAEFWWVEHPGSDLIALLDDALAQLQAGLPL